MPTQDQVFRAADAVLASGARVSLRTVMVKLGETGRAGSFRDLGLHVRDWKARRAYRPALDLRDLPERLQGDLASFATGIWAAAQAEAMAALSVERENMAARAAAGDAILEEALARLDGLEAEAARLRDGIARLQGRHAGDRPGAFRERLLREVFGILPEAGTLNAAQILGRLEPSTVRGATDRDEALSTDRLRALLLASAQAGRYVETDANNRFRRGVFPTLSQEPVLGREPLSID